MKKPKSFQTLSFGFLARIYTLSGALVILLMLVASFSLMSITQIKDNANQLSTDALPTLKASQGFFSTLQTMTLNVISALAEDQAAKVSEYETQYQKANSRALELLNSMEKNTDGKTRQIVKDLQTQLPALQQLSNQTIQGHKTTVGEADTIAVAIRDLQLQFSRFKQDLLRIVITTKDDFVAGSVKDAIIPFEQIEAAVFDAVGTGDPNKVRESQERLNQLLPMVREKIDFVVMDLEPHNDSRTDYSYTINQAYDEVLANIAIDGNGTIARYLAWADGKVKNRQEKTNLLAEQENARRMVSSLIENVEKTTRTLSDETQNRADTSLNVILTVATVSVIIAIIMGIWLSNTMRSALKAVSKSLRELSKGNMISQCTYLKKDEFGQIAEDVNLAAGQMRESLVRIRDSASQLDVISHENETACTQAREGLEKQRGSISQLAAAMTEMESSFAEVANHAMETSNLVGEVESHSNRGSSIMSATRQNTQELSSQLEGSMERIAAVEAQSEQIGQILDVISGIAEQTNLLALNAAIEAARAGEQGRGFAVVADEVRNLASRTAESTTEIHQRIAALEDGIQKAVKSVKESKSRMESNLDQVDSANDVMQQIRQSVEQIAAMSKQISEATQQQQHAAEEISENMNTIHHAADSNMNIVNRITETSSNAASMATEQQELCQRYKI